MSAAIHLEPDWTPVGEDELAAELRGVANGRRTDGERSRCGQYLIARLPSHHPLRSDTWELYGREAGRWSVKSGHATRELARAEVVRQRELARGRSALRVPCVHCGGSGWRAGDDCWHCAGSGTRQAAP